jgi:beta-glucosidase
MAGITSITRMCSYNLVNGTYTCKNNNTMNGILKNKLGFQGFVMTDWFVQRLTVSVITSQHEHAW